MLYVAGENAFSVDAAATHIRDYGRVHRETIRFFDLGGPDEVDVQDAVSTADIGRMVLINAGLSGDDAAYLLADVALDLTDLSVDLALSDVAIRRGDKYYDAMERQWHALVTHHLIGQAKASKLLHLKRPKLFPIPDSHIVRTYRNAAIAEGERLGWGAPHYWSAIAEDVRANAQGFADVRDALSESSDTRHLRHLTDVRLQDILAWRP